MFKRIVSLFVATCLLFSVFCVTASAAPVYSVQADTFSYNVNASALDNGIALAEVTQSELASLFQQYFYYGGDEVGYFLYQINNKLGNFTTSNSLYHYIDLIYGQLSNTQNNSGISGMLYDMLNYSLISNSSYLNQSGGTTTAFSAVGMAELIRSGFLGLSVKLDNVADAVSAGANYTSVLSQILNAANNINTSVGKVETAVGKVESVVGDVETAVGQVNTSVGQVNSSVGGVNTSITSLISEFSVPVGSNVLGSLGSPTSFSLRSFSDMIRIGLVGLGSGLRLEGDGVGLGSSGTVISYSNSTKYGTLMRDGFLGLRSLISGTESDNVYSLTLWDNNNDSSSVNATGLGPMLRVALGNFGFNLGKLTFMFASDDDIKLKTDSAPLLDETDSFYDGSSKVGVSADNIGSLKDYVGQASDILDTGTDADDLFTVVSNENSWLWFSAETAADLNTVPMTASEFGEDIYHSDFAENLYAEFYASYFPDR